MNNLEKLLSEFLDDKTIKMISMKANELGIKIAFRKSLADKRNIRNELVKRDGCVCMKCHVLHDIHLLTIDHIIPKAILFTLNLLDYPGRDNLELLCKECNTRKASQLDFTNPRTIPMLRKFLDMYEGKYEKIQ
jgi:5-methylcytosine-specific restriction endonuclease McrA